jgi:cytidylate kinase
MSDYDIITIDGPAGSGKSTAARALARRLRITYFSSGALYRAIVYLGIRDGIDLDDTAVLLKRLGEVRIETRTVDGDEHVFLDGEDVHASLFANEISRQVFHVADPPTLRREVGRLAHELTSGRSFVTEGRDQGTDVFPEATVKFYLDAQPEERARRRWAELRSRGENVSEAEVLRQVTERDRRDLARPVGALKKAADAIVVDNSELTVDETVDRLYELVKNRHGD